MSGAGAPAGPLAVAAVLLVAAGAAKAYRPETTAKALGAAGLGVGAAVVRAGSILEATVGLGALVVGGPVAAALVGLSYLALATFVARALRQGTPLATCACFAEADTPPTVLHVAVNLGLAVAAGVALAAGPMATRPLTALGLAGMSGVAVATYLVYLCLGALPRLAVP